MISSCRAKRRTLAVISWLARPAASVATNANVEKGIDVHGQVALLSRGWYTALPPLTLADQGRHPFHRMADLLRSDQWSGSRLDKHGVPSEAIAQPVIWNWRYTAHSMIT